MKRGKSLTIGACIAALGLANVPTFAQDEGDGVSEVALLSEARGGFGFIGLKPDQFGRTPDNPMDQYAAKALTGQQISQMFSELCLKAPFDAKRYDLAIQGQGGFSSQVTDVEETSIPKPLLGSTTRGATQIRQHASTYGISGLWLGENAEQLEGRYFLRYSGSLVITGPFKAKNIYAPQCNLTLRATGLTSGTELLDGIEASASGFVSLKRKEKKKYAQATWTGPQIDGRVPRISASVSSLHKPEQTVHLTLQLLPEGKVK